MPEKHQGIHISFEGISGCGKSFILAQLREALQEVPTLVIDAVENRQGSELDQKIIAALRKSGDRFFRGGHPYTETLLLLALQAYDAETKITPALAAGQMVFEDRSIDTIAVYQALILHPTKTLTQQLQKSHQLYRLACKWRCLPHITFLLIEDFTIALERSTLRSAHAYTVDEIALLQRAAALYERYAQEYDQRIVRLDRCVMETAQIVQTIQEIMVSWYKEGR